MSGLFSGVQFYFRCPGLVLGVRILCWVSEFCLRCPDFV